jgi:hypothetical protein
MKIERSLFLALTGAIAGAACVVYTEPHNPPTQPAPSVPPGATAVPPTQPTVATNPAAPPPPKHVVSAGAVHDTHAGGGSNPPAPTPGPTPPPPPAGSCLDTSAATAGDCTKFTNPSSSSCSFAQSKCSAYNTYFNPKVAAQAYSCMQGASNVCSGTAPYDCGKSALQQSCPDPNVATLCQAYAGLCKTDANTCSSLISGLNATGRQKVAQCVSSGCSAGLYSCIEGLSTTSVGH